MKKLISIVIPAYNEEKSIPLLSKELIHAMNTNSNYSFEVIVVEHGSLDKTFEKLLDARKKDKRIKILRLAKNVGCDGGIIAGLSYARGDAAVVMMADLQDDPKDIVKFIKKWQEGYDVVYAVITRRTKVKAYKRFGAVVFYKLMNFFSKGLVPENVSDFRLMDRKVYTIVTSLPEHNKFFRGLVAWTGFSQTGILTIRNPRVAGKEKSNLKTLLSVGINGILSFSILPLRMSWVLSGVFIIAAILSIFMKNVLESIIFISLCLFSFQLGIQGEYVGRIIDEVRKRPNFIVWDKRGI